MNLKKFVRERTNLLLKLGGFELRSFRPDCDFGLSTELDDLRRSRVAETIIYSVRNTWLAPYMPETTVRSWVDDFSDIFKDPPFKQTIGGAGYVNGVLIYCVVRALRPSIIVESGVFRGFTTWVISAAAPKSKIYCFDLDFSHLNFRAPNAEYFQSDWMNVDLELSPDTLGFFDDHVSHARRVVEADQRGLKYLLFDDDITLTTVYTDIPMLIPTISMLHDQKLDDFNVIEYSVGTRNFSQFLDKDNIRAARNLISSYTQLPRLHDIVMLQNSPLAAVILK